MTQLIQIITATDPDNTQPLAGRFCPFRLARHPPRRMCRPGRIPPSERQPLRTRPRPILPLCHPSLSSATQARSRRQRLHPLRRLRQPPQPPFRRSDRDLSGRAEPKTAPTKRSPAPSPPPIISLGFQTLADQVRRSVRSVRGNQWMFRTGHPADHPLRVRPRTAPAQQRSLPHPARSDAGAHGSHPQRLERHLLPGHGLSRRGAGHQHLHRPQRAPRWPFPTSQPARRSLLPRHRRADAASGQRRSGSNGRNHVPWPKSSTSPATTSACSKRPSSPPASCPQAWKAPANRSADLLAAARRPGPRHRNRQPGQRHPQRLAPRRLHQPARLPHRRLHARHRPGRSPHRPAQRRRTTPRRRARHPRRMVRRFRRRLARLRRRLAGHETDPGRTGRPGRSRIRHQPRPSAAQPSHLHTGRGIRGRRAASCKKASCSCTAEWPKTSAPSWRWSPKNTCSAPKRNGPVARKRCRSWMRLSSCCARATSAPSADATNRNFSRTDPDDHPLGWQPLHRSPHPTARATASAMRFLGFLDAGRHGRRRHGLHL